MRARLRRSLRELNTADFRRPRAVEPADESDEGLRQTTRDIEEALRLFDQGRYGICERCGDPIETGRLLAIPWATRCIECDELRYQ